MQWNFAFALLMLIGGTYAYSLQHIGGGDLKLLTVAFLWTGPWLAVPFVVLLLIFTVAYYVAAGSVWPRRSAPPRGFEFPWLPRWPGRLSECLRWVSSARIAENFEAHS